MHAGIKLIFGIILILLGLWLLVPAGAPLVGAVKPVQWATIGRISLDWSSEFLTVVKGMIPPVIIILGILIVWIESEELKSPVIPEVEEKPKKKPKKKKPAKKK